MEDGEGGPKLKIALFFSKKILTGVSRKIELYHGQRAKPVQNVNYVQIKIIII